MDDFDEILNELIDDGGEPARQPTYRATIRGEKVTLTAWAGWLTTGGAMGQLFRDRERAGVAIADLTVEGEHDDELIVRFYSHGRSRDQAETALIKWASRVGYRRLWLSDRVVEVDPHPEQLGHAEVRCPTCRAPWTDANPEFWLFVRRQRSFPTWCPLCGCELPQWTVSETPPAERPRSRQRGSKWPASDRRPSQRPTNP